MRAQLPPELNAMLEKHIGKARTVMGPHLRAVGQYLEPLWAEFGPQIIALLGKAKKQWASRSVQGAVAGTVGNRTMASTFRHMLVVGLNRSELLIQGEEQPVSNDSWQELIDDTMRRHMALVFFAPRDLEGRPVDPIPFLMGDEEGTILAQTPSVLQGVALHDYCRLPPALPNTVNILAAADCIFHWDSKDTYVSPTAPTTWVRDVEGIIKTYPRTTRAHIYTQWETNLITPTERLTLHALRELPVTSQSWLNEPTVQERYSMHALVAGIAAAVLVVMAGWWQGQGVDALTEDLNIVQQQIPRGGQFSDMERAVTEQEKQFALRPLFELSVKDIHRAIAQSGLMVEQIELKVPDTNQVPESYVLSLTMPTDAYSGWLQQEPIARSFLMNTAMVHAVRKPPSSAGFKLEGLIMLNPWLREYKKIAKDLPTAAPVLPNRTTAKADEEGAE
jgi:hypothetical protein